MQSGLSCQDNFFICSISLIPRRSEEKESKYREICTNIIWAQELLSKAYQQAKRLREQKPKMVRTFQPN